MAHSPIRNHNGNPLGDHGFTLIEMMVTLAVAVIVVTLVIPSFTRLLHNNQARNLGFELQSTLNMARSEAIKRNRQVTVCAKQADAIQCDNSAGGQGEWQDGWLVFLDDDDDNVYDAGEELLRLREALEMGSIQSNSADTDVDFRASGSVLPFDNRTYRICLTDNQKHGIILASSGRARHINADDPDVDPTDVDTVQNVTCP
ncbi:MAG: GspH/FimT family pseudopilin [Candidatus Competibacteraceae bacterium]|nr:GspH/FimT family pseudopilin [Candidatus Competibacteraceae bacterium]